LIDHNTALVIPLAPVKIQRAIVAAMGKARSES
jgi:hypothetical protein